MITSPTAHGLQTKVNEEIQYQAKYNRVTEDIKFDSHDNVGLIAYILHKPVTSDDI